jgi:hypothetical protein
MATILAEYMKTQVGHECLIHNYLCLIQLKLDVNIYTVIHVVAVEGDWTDEPKSSKSNIFTDYESANKYFSMLVDDIEAIG